MKLPENAWDKPEGVSRLTWLVYKHLYDIELQNYVASGTTFGVESY